MGTPHATLDQKVIEDLRELDDTGEFVREIFTLFITSTPAKLEAMRAAAASESFKEITGLAHQLKSSGGNLGASHFHKLCNELEDFSSWENKAALAKLLGSIESEFENVRNALQAEMVRAA